MHTTYQNGQIHVTVCSNHRGKPKNKHIWKTTPLLTRTNRTPRHYCVSNVFQNAMEQLNTYRGKTGLTDVN